MRDSYNGSDKQRRTSYRSAKKSKFVGLMDEKVQEISRQRPTYLPTWVERDNKAEKEFENWK